MREVSNLWQRCGKRRVPGEKGLTRASSGHRRSSARVLTTDCVRFFPALLSSRGKAGVGRPNLVSRFDYFNIPMFGTTIKTATGVL